HHGRPAAGSELPVTSKGIDDRNFAAGVLEAATASGVGVGLHSAYFAAYCGLTRMMMCCTDVSSRCRNGAGYRPIQTASTISGAKVANSRLLRSSSRSFFGFSTFPNIVRWYSESM